MPVCSIKCIGKYIHLMRALEPIASSVFVSMTQLLDYYLLVVYTFFTRNLVSNFCFNSRV